MHIDLLLCFPTKLSKSCPFRFLTGTTRCRIENFVLAAILFFHENQNSKSYSSKTSKNRPFFGPYFPIKLSTGAQTLSFDEKSRYRNIAHVIVMSYQFATFLTPKVLHCHQPLSIDEREFENFSTQELIFFT